MRARWLCFVGPSSKRWGGGGRMTKPEETANASRLGQPTEGSERGRKRRPQQRQRQPVGNTRGDSDSDSGDERNRGKGDFDGFCSTTRYNIYIWTLGASGVGSRSECKKSSEKRRVILDARAGTARSRQACGKRRRVFGREVGCLSRFVEDLTALHVQGGTPD